MHEFIVQLEETYLLSALEVIFEFVVEWSLARLSMLTDQIDVHIGICCRVWFVTSEHGNFVFGRYNARRDYRMQGHNMLLHTKVHEYDFD